MSIPALAGGTCTHIASSPTPKGTRGGDSDDIAEMLAAMDTLRCHNKALEENVHNTRQC